MRMPSFSTQIKTAVDFGLFNTDLQLVRETRVCSTYQAEVEVVHDAPRCRVEAMLRFFIVQYSAGVWQIKKKVIHLSAKKRCAGESCQDLNI